MKNQLLEKLKALQKVRGDINAFANHDEFLPWCDSVAPLLEFDEALYKKFIYWSDHVKFAYNMGRDHHDQLGESIGVVNQAIIKLELQPEKEKGVKTERESEIPYPDKLTLKWLFQHTPLSLWSFLFGLLLTAFASGIWLSETQFYQLLTNKPSQAPAQQQELNKSSKLDAVNEDPS